MANASLPDIPEISLPAILKPALEHKPRGFFADQFENQSNYWAHYHGTGPEIIRQTSGNLDAFVSGAGMFAFLFPTHSCSQRLKCDLGTGGTIAGTGKYLKSVSPSCKIILADPEGEHVRALMAVPGINFILSGSGLYNKVKYNVMFDLKESEGKKRRLVRCFFRLFRG